MKTTKCLECGQEIPASSIVCPKCNARCLSSKKKNVAAVLSICLGLFGVQNFYLGYKTSGFAEIASTALGVLLIWLGATSNTTFLVLGILLVALIFIIGVVEGILIATKVIGRDSSGKRLG